MKTEVQLIGLGLTAKEAKDVMLLESEMYKRAVKFQFRKKDGTLRDAVGTLKRELMKLADGTLWEPKGEGKPEADNNLRFFDMEKQLWRSLTVNNLISVEA